MYHQLTVTAVEFEGFLEHVQRASHTITVYKDEWEVLIKEAAKELEVARKAPSQYSYYNGTLGPINPYTTKASFEWLDSLGGGTYGRVSKVRETTTGTLYAQKIIRINDSRSRSRIEKEVLNEVSIMQKLRHHHIASVQFHTFETDTYSIIMLPVAECDLHRFLGRCTDAHFLRVEITYLTSWFGCLVGALAYAHSKDIKHEDIKSRNILIKDHQPYLADFGCAQDFSGLDSSTSIDTLTTGTPAYWAPESPPRGRSADVFSLGCVFSEMLSVRHKRSLEEFQAFRYVEHRENPYAFKESLGKVVAWLNDAVPPTDEVGTLLKEQTCLMLVPDPFKRLEARQIKKNLRVEGEAVFCSTCY